MKNFIETIKNIWKIEELKNKLVITVGLLLVYRFGCQVTLPGIDANRLGHLAQQSEGAIGGLLNMFTGGAFSQASVFALGIMPYISASIIVQLMGFAIPYLQKLQSDGESGRKKMNQITRWLTIAITLLQGPGYIFNLYKTVPDAFLLDSGSFSFLFSSIIILSTGTIFAMWLGEKITNNGIGNGISLLIMVGIIARMPEAFLQEFASRTVENNGGLMLVIFEVILWLVIIAACILLSLAVRRITVQYARRIASGGFDQSMMGGRRQYIPLKLNASGVMPIIFAQAIMFVPAAVAGFVSAKASEFLMPLTNAFSWQYNLVFALLIIIFAYFYTAITVPTNKMSDDLKRSGGFIPGVKPGKDTAAFLDRVLSLITLPGSLALAFVAIFPSLIQIIMGIQKSWALFYGGTSLLIMVGVVIDTIQQVNAYLLNKRYDSMLTSGKNRKSISQ